MSGLQKPRPATRTSTGAFLRFSRFCRARAVTSPRAASCPAVR